MGGAVILVYCCIENSLFEVLTNHYANLKNNYDIELTNELAINPNIVILDLENKKSKNIIASLKRYSNNKFLPIIFINAKENNKIFYYDNFPFSSVLCKSILVEDIVENIKRKINILNECNIDPFEIIKVTTDKKDLIILKKDIIYIESYSNKTVLHCKDKSIFCKHTKLSDCKTFFGDEFLVCHRKYAVNKSHISSINTSNKVVYLYNNRKCVKIGRVFKKTFLEEVYML